MKKLLYIAIILAIIPAVTGCRDKEDKRLVLADTLMWTNPDSSLTILESINRDSLQGDENRAYHALLLTQAQFRVDYAIPSDSLINLAVDYYCNNNREHYTRSLLYKGAFYEVNDNPVEAIKWYKQAEDNADTTDYRNLAQINMRMGALYFMNYASNNLDLNKFQLAAHYYEKLGDKRMLMTSLHYCGNVLRISDVNEARKCYDKALPMARELKDTTNIYSINVNYALMYIKDSLYSQAKKYILEAYRLNNRFEENCNYYMLSLIYANQKDIDSAKYFISLPDKSQNTAYDSLLMYKALKEIALCENNIPQYREFDKQYYRISDSLEHNETKYKLHDSEQEFDKSTKSEASLSLGKKKTIISLLIGLLLLISAVFLLLYSKKKKDAKRLIEELNRNKQITENLLLEYKGKTFVDDDNSNLTIAIIAYLEQHFNSLKTLLEKSKSMKHYEFVQELDKRSHQLGKNEEIGKLLVLLANDKYNNLIQRLKEQYPSLNENDLKLLSLVSLGYDNDGIAFCTGITKESVKTKKTRMKNKMNLEMSIDAFVTQEKLMNTK